MGELQKRDLERLRGGASLGRMIEQDMACGECGYNLKGLRFGGTCPECGAPISTLRRRKEPPMGDSPDLYLKQMALGTTLVGLGGFGWLAWLIVRLLIEQIGGMVFGMSPLLMVAVTAVWGAGVILILRERPFAKERRLGDAGGPPEWVVLRGIVLVTQMFAFGVAASIVLQVLTGSDFWLYPLAVSMLVMLAGWSPLCVYLSRIAYWAGDDDLGARLASMGWWLGVLGAGVAMLFAPDIGAFVFLKFVGVVCLVFFVLLSLLVMFSLMRMSTTVQWAERNAANARARDRRMVERARREAEKADQERARREEVAGGSGGTIMTSDQEALLAEIERKHRESQAEATSREDGPAQGPMPGQQHVVKSGDNVETFGLEDDDERGRRG